jgi:hypothetical protein
MPRAGEAARPPTLISGSTRGSDLEQVAEGDPRRRDDHEHRGDAVGRQAARRRTFISNWTSTSPRARP